MVWHAPGRAVEHLFLKPHKTRLEGQTLWFVRDQYVAEGVGEPDGDKLPAVISLEYATPHDAVQILGDINGIRDAFIGFLIYLYERDAAA